jgi:hypothetical protein
MVLLHYCEDVLLNDVEQRMGPVGVEVLSGLRAFVRSLEFAVVEERDARKGQTTRISIEIAGHCERGETEAVCHDGDLPHPDYVRIGRLAVEDPVKLC